MNHATDFRFEEWPPEAVAARLRELDAYFKENECPGPEAIPTAFEFVHLLIFERQLYAAGEMLGRIEPWIEAALAQDPEGEAYRLAKIDWLQLALGFVAFRADEYAELPYFQEMLSLSEGREGTLGARWAQATVGVVHNYRVWLDLGGQPDSLNPADRRWLNEQFIELDTVVNDVADRLLAQSDVQNALAVQRTLGRFWFQNAEPEKAETIYTSILDRLPSLPSYSPTDEADLQLELGQLFLQSNRIVQAKTALAQALALYEQAGEEFELLALQAEALLADLD